jgi:hypothetical protein
MLTLVESISLAGDRAKQNDDAFGFTWNRAWVIDGATDLHDAPLTGAASDASWLAHHANVFLHQTSHDIRQAVRMASVTCAREFALEVKDRAYERWQSPIASVLTLETMAYGVRGIDLGDCRIFALDDEGAVHVAGGPEGARDAEAAAAAAAQQTDADKPLLQRTATIDMLRRSRASLNQEGAHWTFGLDPKCVDHARGWAFEFKKSAHLLLMTDGFAVLADQYGAYDPAGLVRAAVDKGLQELGREIRAIENADSGGAAHPRFKKSDDATALLMRLTLAD